jgi:hypothetical protein
MSDCNAVAKKYIKLMGFVKAMEIEASESRFNTALH